MITLVRQWGLHRYFPYSSVNVPGDREVLVLVEEPYGHSRDVPEFNLRWP